MRCLHCLFLCENDFWAWDLEKGSWEILTVSGSYYLSWRWSTACRRDLWYHFPVHLLWRCQEFQSSGLPHLVSACARVISHAYAQIPAHSRVFVHLTYLHVECRSNQLSYWTRRGMWSSIRFPLRYSNSSRTECQAGASHPHHLHSLGILVWKSLANLRPWTPIYPRRRSNFIGFDLPLPLAPPAAMGLSHQKLRFFVILPRINSTCRLVSRCSYQIRTHRWCCFAHSLKDF